jgi:hypothetical protein
MIDVFMSRPTWVDASFEGGLNGFLTRLKDLGMRACTLGTSEYPTEAPLDEVINLLDRCRGAVILGYPQIRADSGYVRDRPLSAPLLLPTEWNHIEAGLAYARSLPLLVIHHTGVGRGIFDRGAISKFIYEIDLSDPTWPHEKRISGALEKWRDSVLAKRGLRIVNREIATDPGAIYKLKGWIYVRNETSETIAVSKPQWNSVPAAPLQRASFVTAFSLKSGASWQKETTDSTIVVYPGQEFKFWVGFDPERVKEAELSARLNSDELGSFEMDVFGLRERRWTGTM